MATVAETHGKVIPRLCFMAHGGLSEAGVSQSGAGLPAVGTFCMAH